MFDWVDYARKIQEWVIAYVTTALQRAGINTRTIDASYLRGEIGSGVLLPPHAPEHEAGGSDEIDLGFLAGTINDAQHGARTGGSTHALATALANGFMSATDFERFSRVTLPASPATVVVPAAGTVALLGTANEFTASQTIKAVSTGQARKLTLKSANSVGAGTGGNLEIEFDDNGTVVGRFLVSTGNVAAADRYMGVIGLTDRDGNRYPHRFFVLDAGGTGRTGLYIGAGADAGRTVLNNVASAITALGTLTIYGSAAADKGIVLRAASSVTANLLEMQTSAGAILAAISATGQIGAGTAPSAMLHGVLTDAATNAINTVAILGHNTSGGVTNGFGSRLLFQLEAGGNTPDQDAAAIEVSWITGAFASRAAVMKFFANYQGTSREALALGANSTTSLVGFHGATPVAKSTGWTITAGYTADKSFNPESTTNLETARVLATLIDYFITRGDLGT